MSQELSVLFTSMSNGKKSHGDRYLKSGNTKLPQVIIALGRLQPMHTCDKLKYIYPRMTLVK